MTKILVRTLAVVAAYGCMFPQLVDMGIPMYVSSLGAAAVLMGLFVYETFSRKHPVPISEHNFRS